jgi:hypothetical protein
MDDPNTGAYGEDKNAVMGITKARTNSVSTSKQRKSLCSLHLSGKFLPWIAIYGKQITPP